ncbi:MAG: phospholipase A [Nitrospirae bacterium]|nr:phospholipase A [Nitrospirota bacterium]
MMPEKYLTHFSLLILLLVIMTGNRPAFAQQGISDCSKIDDDKERLKCLDEQISKKPEDNPERFSYLSKLWELDTGKSRNKYIIMPHRSTYILPVSYNNRPNEEPLQQASSDKDIRETEVKFQISMKVKLWQDILDKDIDLWFGYTQQSFWQLYNFADSSPFRETNYEPELLFNFRTNFNFLGMQGRMINVGINHQSNGQSKPLSRSWNRIVGNIGFERENFAILLKTWYRIPESVMENDNPDIDKYMGYGEIWGYYFWRKNRFGLMMRDNLRTEDNRGALQFEWNFPMIKSVGGYVQYFTGYGENLLDYNHSVNRIGIGLMLTDWN